MSIYFNTNIPEMRSLFQFNRVSLEIAELTRRLESGQRIISAKDDPVGLIMRESMRTDIAGIQSAQKTTKAANDFLATAESGMANISRLLLGDITKPDDNGLIGLIYDTTLPSNMKKQQINDILNMIDGTVRATNYNGKQMLNGSMDYRLSGVDSNKLFNVSVSSASFDTAKGQQVTVSVLEQARQGALQFSSNDLDLTKDFHLRLKGKPGEEVVIDWATGHYDRDKILDEVNAKTERTGVQARLHGTTLIFETLDIGSGQSLALSVHNGSVIDVTDMTGKVTNMDTGRDVRVKVNGHEVLGKGRQIEYASPELSMSATIASTMKAGSQTQFNVAGGALFQLGKDVQYSMQYRTVIPSMTTSHLGGESGTLYDLRTIDLETDAGKAQAYSIVLEAVDMVAKQRGNIGAVQKNVLQSNTQNLDIQLEKVSEAEGIISNVDMALESSRLNRAELLAQSAMKAILYSRSYAQFFVNLLS
ncbi:MAG: flagellin [Planctomycetaceae bacterium]|jgi:flagellin|nr:flagellin [Planctomycetaceae bacterium]